MKPEALPLSRLYYYDAAMRERGYFQELCEADLAMPNPFLFELFEIEADDNEQRKAREFEDYYSPQAVSRRMRQLVWHCLAYPWKKRYQWKSQCTCTTDMSDIEGDIAEAAAWRIIESHGHETKCPV